MLARFFSSSARSSKLHVASNSLTRNVFVISLEYIAPMEKVERYLEAHRDFVDSGYRDGVFIVSGRKVPRTGGIILALSDNREALENLLNDDPFKIHKIAEYSITEFVASRYIGALEELIESNKNRP